ncbi:AI-2E family transporter [Candidatus Azambacteria bacterium]|nr:AI-2E family transporter [Candidatus Azambacteria bacterium]
MSMTPKQIIEISTWTILRGILILLFFVFLFLIKDILIILFLSLIIASSIYPIVNYLQKKGIPRIAGVLSVYLLVILFIALLLYLVVPTIIDEIRQLASVLPSYYDDISNKFSRTVIEVSPDYAKTTQEFLINFGDKIKDITSSALKTIAGIFGGFATFGIIFVISFYLAFQEKGIESFIRMVTPKKNEEYVLNLWERVQKKLGLWLQGQIILGAIIGVMVFLGLTILGVPYALLLGILAGVFEIVPVVGPIFSAATGVIVALIIDPMLGIWTTVFYLIIQQLENHILVPNLMKKMTGLNPIVVIVSLLIGLDLGGILGMLISVPIATIVSELLSDYAIVKNAEEKSTAVSDS